MFGKLFGKKSGSPVEVVGFELTDPYSHMLPWLGRGANPAEYVARDVENELTRQQPGCRLTRIVCTGEPEVETTANPQIGTSQAHITRMSASFPLEVSVTAPDGVKWRLAVTQTYVVSGLEGEKHHLRQDFKVNEATAV